MFGEASGLTGANLVKGNTPYPIFLPYVVRSLIDAYRFYSGPERLKRLGADLNEDRGERDNDNHGEWSLVPSSLGLVVVRVLQAKRKGFGGKEVRNLYRVQAVASNKFHRLCWRHRAASARPPWGLGRARRWPRQRRAALPPKSPSAASGLRVTASARRSECRSARSWYGWRSAGPCPLPRPALQDAVLV